MTGAPVAHHHPDEPSTWVLRWVQLIPRGGRVLDVACGAGRHSRLLARLGFRVDAVDRDSALLASLTAISGITPKCADLESGPWPYAGEIFDGVIVVHYLHRPLFPHLLSAVAPGGVLIYETFAAGNERYGRPANPDHLLRPGELLDLVHGRLRVVAYEDLFVEEPRPAMVQRICAVRPS